MATNKQYHKALDFGVMFGQPLVIFAQTWCPVPCLTSDFEVNDPRATGLIGAQC